MSGGKAANAERVLEMLGGGGRSAAVVVTPDGSTIGHGWGDDVIHAVASALLESGTPPYGSTMYANHQPCPDCMGHLGEVGGVALLLRGHATQSTCR